MDHVLNKNRDGGRETEKWTDGWTNRDRHRQILARWDHPNSWKIAPRMLRQIKTFHVGSHQFRESLRELLWELWLSYCSSYGISYSENEFRIPRMEFWIPRAAPRIRRNSPLRAQRLKKIKIALRDWNFQSRLKFSSEPPSHPLLFVGNSEGQDWKFQSRLKISSEIEIFNRDWIFSIFGPLGSESSDKNGLLYSDSVSPEIGVVPRLLIDRYEGNPQREKHQGKEGRENSHGSVAVWAWSGSSASICQSRRSCWGQCFGHPHQDPDSTPDTNIWRFSIWFWLWEKWILSTQRTLPFMPGRDCLRALFRKQFPPPLNWVKSGFSRTSRNGLKWWVRSAFLPA